MYMDIAIPSSQTWTITPYIYEPDFNPQGDFFHFVRHTLLFDKKEVRPR